MYLYAMEEKWIQQAIQLATESVKKGGGPFGAVIVKDGQCIAEAANTVTPDNDPTAHAEVNAIRKAGKFLGTHHLGGCELYTSCEPCPMCLGAILWARIDKVYFAASSDDAARAGFDDSHFYSEVRRSIGERELPMVYLPEASRMKPFEAWQAFAQKQPY